MLCLRESHRFCSNATKPVSNHGLRQTVHLFGTLAGLLWQFLLSPDPDNYSAGNSFIASLNILGLRYAVVASARYVSYHK